MAGATIRSAPDEDFLYRRQEVRVRGAPTIVTPAKSVDPARMPCGTRLGCTPPRVNELYAGVTKKGLSACAGGENPAAVRQLNALQRRLRDPPSGLRLCFVEYREPSLPTRKETGIMAALAHKHSDMVPIPMLSNFVERASNVSARPGGALSPSREKLNKITSYLASSIQEIGELNGKPIMGYVPDYRLYFAELIKLYADSGINAFYFDAHGSSPVALAGSLRALVRELAANGMLENSFVHMINPGQGRVIRDIPTAPAKDILGFGLGIDSLGETHADSGKMPWAVRGRGGSSGGRRRLFDKDTYRYVRTADRGEIERFYPDDSSIDRLAFLPGAGPDGKARNAFNVEQLEMESARLRGMIGASEPLAEYLSGKAGVSEADVEILKRAGAR